MRWALHNLTTVFPSFGTFVEGIKEAKEAFAPYDEDRPKLQDSS
jgi:hypothetical protein